MPLRDRHGEFLDLLRRYEILSVKQRHRLRRFHQRDGCTRTRAQLHALRRARGGDEIHDVAFQFATDTDVFHGALHGDDIGQRRGGFQFIKWMVVFLRGENGNLFLGGNVAERELHREPIHLRLRQRIRPAKFHGVFRGDDEK